MRVAYYFRHKAVYKADHVDHPIPRLGEIVATKDAYYVVCAVVHDHFRDVIAVALDVSEPPKTPASWGRKPE